MQLPIDKLLPDIAGAARRHRCLVLEAEPGAGKTTRVPPALLEACSGEILVSEPRRLPARLAARFVAAELGQQVGHTVGYSVRFEEASSSATRLRYVTEGVLLRRLLSDPTLAGVAAVVLDEFHERHLAGDVALALIDRLQRGPRPDLRLIVMSATLDGERIAAHLFDAVRLSSPGRVHPVRIEHLPKADDRPLEKQVSSAVKQALRAPDSGDVLVFLPGASEIRRTEPALAELGAAHDLAVLPLHGDLPLEQQARAVEPGPRRKLILSTNVAESSITIDGVTAVIDSGLARVASLSPWTGVARLSTAKVSRAALAQRAGRAGRTRPGIVLRLFTRGDFEGRPEHDKPEIERLDLSETLPMLHGSGIQRPEELRWLTPPPRAALEAAQTLLADLGALEPSGGISLVGRRMLRFPVPPRLARLIVEGERRGRAAEACLAAALLGERDIRAATRTRLSGGSRGHYDASGPSDVLELMQLFWEAEGERFRDGAVRSLELDRRTLTAVDRARRQLERLADTRTEPEPLELEQTLGLCLLAGFPDRLARRRSAGGRELILSSGGVAKLSEHSVVHQAPLVLALDVDEQTHGMSRVATVRLACAVEPEWLLELQPERIRDSVELDFNPGTGRVERTRRSLYGSVVLDESTSPAPPSDESAAVLFRALLGKRPSPIESELEAVERLLLRLELLRAQLPEAGLPEASDSLLPELLAHACREVTSVAELRGLDLPGRILSELDPKLRELVRNEVPERITLPGGRQMAVHYERDKPPWVESRLQDFFGLASAPRLCRGRLALTLHLLAPNNRAVQVTTDLAGFWERHYPTIRRELMRRYPRHAWPEDGRSAAPPAPRRR